LDCSASARRSLGLTGSIVDIKKGFLQGQTLACL
jgi:hypothetical protein